MADILEYVSKEEVKVGIEAPKKPKLKSHKKVISIVVVAAIAVAGIVIGTPMLINRYNDNNADVPVVTAGPIVTAAPEVEVTDALDQVKAIYAEADAPFENVIEGVFGDGAEIIAIERSTVVGVDLDNAVAIYISKDNEIAQMVISAKSTYSNVSSNKVTEEYAVENGVYTITSVGSNLSNVIKTDAKLEILAREIEAAVESGDIVATTYSEIEIAEDIAGICDTMYNVSTQTNDSLDVIIGEEGNSFINYTKEDAINIIEDTTYNMITIYYQDADGELCSMENIPVTEEVYEAYTNKVTASYVNGVLDSVAQYEGGEDLQVLMQAVAKASDMGILEDYAIIK